MKRSLLIIVLAIGSSCGPKVIIETPGFDEPEWIYGIEKGYFIGKGTGKDHVEAKDAALENVIYKISAAIAQHASSNSKLDIYNRNRDNNIQSGESFEVEQVKKTYSHILNGIRLEKSQDYFWRKRIVDGKVEVTYYIKYPFSEEELQTEIKEWEVIFQEQRQFIDSLLSRPLKFDCAEDAIHEIELLDNIDVDFNDVINSRIDTRKKNIATWLSHLRIILIKNDLGEVRFEVRHGVNSVRLQGYPSISGHGVNVQSIQQIGRQWSVKFDLGELESAKMIICIPIQGFKITEVIHVLAMNQSIKVRIGDQISIRALSFENYHVGWARIQIPIHLLNNSYLTVEQIQISVVRHWRSFWTGNAKKEVGVTHTYSGINARIKGKNEHHLTFKCKFPESTINSSSNYQLTASGTLLVRSMLTGERKTINFYNVELKTSW